MSAAAPLLIAASALIILLLGVAHLVLTYRGIVSATIFYVLALAANSI